MGIGIYENPPVGRLVFYLLLNWVALLILAGSSALGRGRLREWWSAGQDQLALLQRQEIKNALTTFLAALGVSLAGLVALWASFHSSATHAFSQNIGGHAPLLLAIMVCFTLTVAGMAVFIQYCAMQRFRIGAWAGVVLTIIFYVVMSVIGASLSNKKNTAALLNPVVYAASITENDPFMVRIYTDDGASRRSNEEATKGALLHGLIAEGVLAALCFGLAYTKWRKTEEEIAQERR